MHAGEWHLTNTPIKRIRNRNISTIAKIMTTAKSSNQDFCSPESSFSMPNQLMTVSSI